MKIYKNNKGFTLLNLILIIVFLGTVGILGFQIGVAYINQNSIRGAVKSALIEAKQNDTTSTKTIEENIEKKLSVSTIDLGKDDISVTKIEGGFDVEVSYIKEIPINKNIKIVVNLDFSETTAK